MVTNYLLADDAAEHSPIHDQAFAALRALPVNLVRYVPWNPFPRRGVLELEPPSPAALGVCAGPVPDGYNLTIDCGADGGVIEEILYASYALPTRDMEADTAVCRGFSDSGTCASAANVSARLHDACVGRQTCAVTVGPAWGQPCPGVPGPKRLAALARCSIPTNRTYWNASIIDPMMDDFMQATRGRPSIINYCIWPGWATDQPTWAYVDDPNAGSGYSEGSPAEACSPSAIARQAGYYARVLSWYTLGGFTDVFGAWHGGGHHYNISMWEIFNEVDDYGRSRATKKQENKERKKKKKRRRRRKRRRRKKKKEERKKKKERRKKVGWGGAGMHWEQNSANNIKRRGCGQDERRKACNDNIWRGLRTGT